MFDKPSCSWALVKASAVSASAKKTMTLCLAALLLWSSASSAGLLDLYNGVKLGRQLPESNLQYLTDAPDIRNKRLVLIDFWATWCVPCRESIPAFNDLYKKYSGKGLVIIGITDESKEEIESFLARYPMDYPHAVEGDKSLHKALRIKALPYAIFVNQSGTIAWRGQPSDITEKLIESLLADHGG